MKLYTDNNTELEIIPDELVYYVEGRASNTKGEAIYLEWEDIPEDIREVLKKCHSQLTDYLQLCVSYKKRLIEISQQTK